MLTEGVSSRHVYASFSATAQVLLRLRGSWGRVGGRVGAKWALAQGEGQEQASVSAHSHPNSNVNAAAIMAHLDGANKLGGTLILTLTLPLTLIPNIPSPIPLT